MKNVIVRSISGIIYVALIVGAILAGWQYFIALTALLSVLAIAELERLSTGEKANPIAYALDTAAAIAITLIPLMLTWVRWAQVTGVCCSVFALMYFISRIILSLYITTGSPLRQLAKSFFSVIYVALPLMTLNLIYLLQPGSSHWLILAIFITIWLNDTGAFCVGCTLGRHRLWERHSPKKSWEGFWGGMACCIGFGVACNYLFPSVSLNVWQWIIFGIVISAFSTWGDLFESMIKRTCGVKDSGQLIPGHGGILDRIDSLLLVAPASLLYLLAVL